MLAKKIILSTLIFLVVCHSAHAAPGVNRFMPPRHVTDSNQETKKDESLLPLVSQEEYMRGKKDAKGDIIAGSILLSASVGSFGAGGVLMTKEDTIPDQWKSELIANVTISRDVEVGKNKMIFEFYTDANMGGQPALLYSVPVLSSSKDGKIKVAYDFTDLTNGTYYVRACFDGNSNQTFDAGEATGVYNVKGEPSPITIETGKRQAISLSVE